jgi:pilus assembly protein Flp/PilA
MTKLKNWFRNDDDGQGLAEYGLILALVSVVAVAALTALGGGITGTLGTVTTSL